MKYVPRFISPLLSAALVAVACAAPASTQQGDDALHGELRSAVQNPLADLISLPFQNNTSFGIGPHDRTQNTLNIQPVYPVGMGGDWLLVNRVILPVVYQPDIAVIYEKNGVTIKSWPAIHAGDGSVSMGLFWKGMKIVIGGDTMPNKWYIEYAKDADFAIHEAFMTPELLVKFYNQNPATALGVGTYVHTSPQAFGKVMSEIRPRHAVAYHFFSEEGTRYAMYDAIRETYDGPLSLARDMMVWNVTKGGITERMVTSTEEAWGVPGPKAPPPPDRTVPDQLSKWSLDHRWNVDDVQADMIKEFKKKYDMK